MPFIHTRVNRPIDREEEKALARQFGQAIEILGKSERWLMLQFEDGCRMHFQGSDEKPLAFVDVKLYGKAGADAYDAFTRKVTAILGQVLFIPPEGVYVKYEETEYWGWQGSNF